MIALQGIQTARGGKTLFENFSWTIRDGEHWIVTGANGSGKTHLLELIAGQSHPLKGEVAFSFIKDSSWETIFCERKKLIHFITAHALQTFLSGQELFYQQRYYSIGDERIPIVREIFGSDVQKLRELSLPASFGIEPLLDLPLTRLSNGQLKKVLILKNLLQDLPKLMLLDYPFEGLDIDSRNDLISFIDHLAIDHKITMIIVDQEHHLPKVINRKLMLEDFRIKSQGEFRSTETHRERIASKTVGIPSDHAVVEMQNVSIRYGNRIIIKDLNWKILKGERWALTGKNGSGKTTLFSIIYADHPMAYSEKVFLFGRRRGSGESIWDIKKRINYLGPELINYLKPQATRQSASEYIAERIADKTLLKKVADSLPSSGFLVKAVNHLSSGEMQLMLAIVALLSEKELILLDEPFQFLDGENKTWLTDFIQHRIHPDTTLVLITHYENDIANWTAKRMHLS